MLLELGGSGKSLLAVLGIGYTDFKKRGRMDNGASHHIDESLVKEMVKEGLISEDQLAVCLVSCENLGGDLGQILVNKGFVTEDQLLTFLARSLSIPYVHLKRTTIPSDLVQRIPLYLARRYHVVPLRQEGKVVTVAMADPLDRFAMDDVRAALRAEVKPVLALAEEIDQVIEDHYGVKVQPRERGPDLVEALKFFSDESLDSVGDKLEEIATGPRVVQTVNRLISEAHQQKASDIHIEPWRDYVRVRYRVDGFLEERDHLSRDMHLPVVSRIKILGGLDIAERRAPQDGRVQIRMGGKPLDLRVATYPTLYGEKVVLRLLSKEAVVGIDSLGFSEGDRKTFTDLISRSHGIFLVTGPTGSGKSTTLYAALGRLNSPEKNIISIEDPVESEVPGVNQAQINPKAGVTFASALRSILRQDPDVIMIGEIRDGETAEIAVRAAITGHLVLSTLHTNTAVGAISRLIDLGVPPFLISSSLIGVMAQRLVRKVCPVCRVEEETPREERLAPLNEQIRKQFRGKGCPTCRMSGFAGRIGIFEMAPIGEGLRKMIVEKKNDGEMEKELRRLGYRSIWEDGIEKIDQGVTTQDEVLRVTQED